MLNPQIPKISRSKYIQIAKDITQQIKIENLKPGDQLPSAKELCRIYNVSLNTLNKIYGVLEKDGIVTREPGRGIFIARKSNDRLQKGVIGVMIGTYAFKQFTMYWANMFDGIQSVLLQNGLQLLVFNQESDSGIWNKIDGVLICEANINIVEQNMKLMPDGMPQIATLVVVPGISCVVADDYSGGYAAMQHLISLGHERIGFMGLEHYKGLVQQRLQGAKQAMADANLEMKTDWIRGMPYIDKLLLSDSKTAYYETARQTMEEWTKTTWKELGLTAIVAQNDHIGEGIMTFAKEAGIRVPEDLSVVGYDGVEPVNPFLPSLTTIEIPIRQIGIRGTELLLKLIRDDGAPPSIIERVVLSVSLREGASTMPPNGYSP